MPANSMGIHLQRILSCLFAAVFVAIVGMVAMSYMRAQSVKEVPVKSNHSPQQADAPLGFPVGPAGVAAPHDLRFIQLNAFERAAIPTARRMVAPMGSEHGALTYNAQAYWSLNQKRGGHHTGDDYNGIGGMNTDWGDPVYAIANGLVVYRGEPSSGWGNTLIMAHRDLDGAILLSMYAHLEKSFSPYGRIIHMGDTIGTVGTANQNYPAHLHLEMRDSTGVHIGRGYKSDPGECVNPSEVIHSRSAQKTNLNFPCPLAIVLQNQLEQRRNDMFSSQ